MNGRNDEGRRDGVGTVLETERTGLGRRGRPDPCVIVIFGASGDLAHRELLPSLYELAGQDLLPEEYSMVGFARRDWDDEAFRAEMRNAVDEECTLRDDEWSAFASRLHFVSGDVKSDPEDDYARLAEKIEEVRSERGIPPNVLFHLAVPPALFGTIVGRLDAAGLARDEHGWRRLVIEKPFGENLDSARALDDELQGVFDEDRIYRIDHFLGKETVQNMLVFRFANPGFEPIWNRDFVDHVQITVAEEIGIEGRAGFYEHTGVVRDMIQNHLLQLLCMTAIEPPVRFGGAALRDETAKVLEAVSPPDPHEDCVRGQYGPGLVGGRKVSGYRGEEDVPADSTTATFAAMELRIENWRWAGVPFYLRTGKRLERKLTEVSIHFKPTPHLMFPGAANARHRNVLTFRLQPREGILQTFAAKQPGPALTIRPVHMSFDYSSAFGIDEPPRAYAWLLLDAMEGEQTLFARSDWIYRAWSIVDPVVDQWESEPPPDFPNYQAGSWGPASSERLIAAKGREWAVV